MDSLDTCSVGGWRACTISRDPIMFSNGDIRSPWMAGCDLLLSIPGHRNAEENERASGLARLFSALGGPSVDTVCVPLVTVQSRNFSPLISDGGDSLPALS